MDKQIVVLAGKLHPFGGIETHLFHYCMSLAGVASVSLVITSTTYNPTAISALRSANVEVYEFACGRTPTGIWQYLRCLLFLRANPSKQILYSNGTSGFSYVASLFMRPRVWVHHHHGDITTPILNSFSRLYRKTLETADWLILCTAGHARLIEQAYRRPSGTITLPYLKDEPAESVPIPRRSSGGKTIVGFFGRLRESKGVGLLLHLAPWFDSQGIECRLHGDNCEGLIPEDLPKGIVFVGAYNSATDLTHLLSEIDLVVLPSTFAEGLPIVMCEAISRGVPVVCFPAGGLREMGNFHPGIMVVPPTIDGLKEGILEIAKHSNESDFRDGLARLYRERLSNEVTIDWWLNLVRKFE